MSATQTNPNSLANLRPPFKPGAEWKGNPGGNRKGTPHADAAYARLAVMSLEDLRAYNPPNVVEYAVKQGIIRACEATDWQAAHAALKELADRLDGKPEQRKTVEHVISPETRQAIVIEAYTSLFYNRTREESFAAIAAIYDAIEAERDRGEVKELVQIAVQQDSEAISAVWEQAERAVTGSNGVR